MKFRITLEQTVTYTLSTLFAAKSLAAAKKKADAIEDTDWWPRDGEAGEVQITVEPEEA